MSDPNMDWIDADATPGEDRHGGDHWLEAVNQALFRYDQGLLDVRGVAHVLEKS